MYRYEQWRDLDNLFVIHRIDVTTGDFLLLLIPRRFFPDYEKSLNGYTFAHPIITDPAGSQA